MDAVTVTWMASDVDEPWADAIEITNASPAFFAPRNVSLSLYDSDGSVTALAEAARRRHGLDERGHLLDRAVRLYLAHLLDTRSDLTHLRDEHDAVGAIPPAGWVGSYERVSTEPMEGGFEGGATPIKTLAVVKEMVLDVIENSGYETQSGFVKAALYWLTKQ